MSWNQPSTSQGGSARPRNQYGNRSSRRTVSQETHEEGREVLNIEPGFIARVTEKATNFLSVYGVLCKVQPDRKKNFDINIASLLEKYLHDVVYGKDHELPSVVDFAQAGIMLQGTTHIFSKKVDFLDDLYHQLYSYIDSGVTPDEEDGEVSHQAGHKKRVQKEINFEPIEMRPHKNNLKIKPERRAESKIIFRPKFFPSLMRVSQCDIDKKRITSTNPSFSGDKTTFRLWGPVSSEQGYLVRDLSEIVNKFTQRQQESEMESGIDADIDDFMEPLGDMPDIHGLHEQEPEPSGAPTAAVNEIGENGADAARAAASDENKENCATAQTPRDPWAEMEPDDGCENTILRSKVISVKPPQEIVLTAQEHLLKSLFKKTGKTYSFCGDEGYFEEEKLRKNNKMLLEQKTKSTRRKADTPERDVFNDIGDSDSGSERDFFNDMGDSDSDQDVAGFDPDGAIVYAIPTPPPEMDVHADLSETLADWGVPNNPDDPLTAALTPYITKLNQTVQDNQTVEELEYEKLQQLNVGEDAQLAEHLEMWFKKMQKIEEINAAKPQFTFDAYCQKVLQTFPEDEDYISFKNISEAIAPEQTARYLLATMQLANTNNVEIQGMIPGGISNDTLQLSLLNKTRELPHFDDEELGAPLPKT